MSKRKTDNLGALAAGRRVVVSAGTLDGPFLAALAKVQISLQTENSPSPSTWGDGVAIDKSISDMPERGVNDGA